MNKPITNSKPTEQAERCQTLASTKLKYECKTDSIILYKRRLLSFGQIF